MTTRYAYSVIVSVSEKPLLLRVIILNMLLLSPFKKDYDKVVWKDILLPLPVDAFVYSY